MYRETVSFFMPIAPVAVQSVRFSTAGGFPRQYQPARVTRFKRQVNQYAAALVRREFPDFRPYERGEACAVSYVFQYPPPASGFAVAKRKAVVAGARFPKATQPDVTDNLNKGLTDALTGVLWLHDGVIAECHARKVYAARPGIWISVAPVDLDAPEQT